jgi:hypothetical protein
VGDNNSKEEPKIERRSLVMRLRKPWTTQQFAYRLKKLKNVYKTYNISRYLGAVLGTTSGLKV